MASRGAAGIDTTKAEQSHGIIYMQKRESVMRRREFDDLLQRERDVVGLAVVPVAKFAGWRKGRVGCITSSPLPAFAKGYSQHHQHLKSTLVLRALFDFMICCRDGRQYQINVTRVPYIRIDTE